MSSTSAVTISSDITGAEYGHAWRADDGTPCATVHLGDSTIRFEDSALARATAAECLKAADAMDALPPAGGGQP